MFEIAALALPYDMQFDGLQYDLQIDALPYKLHNNFYFIFAPCTILCMNGSYDNIGTF